VESDSTITTYYTLLASLLGPTALPCVAPAVYNQRPRTVQKPNAGMGRFRNALARCSDSAASLVYQRPPNGKASQLTPVHGLRSAGMPPTYVASGTTIQVRDRQMLSPGDLDHSLKPGSLHRRLLLMWKPVRLQRRFCCGVRLPSMRTQHPSGLLPRAVGERGKSHLASFGFGN